jgi:aminoglycoside phosphotransferase (APT) family kinase protein
MRSPTQRELDESDIAALLGEPVAGAAELAGGGFATVWRATLADGRDVVLKVGPPATARLLDYERGMIAAEAEYFRLVRDRAPGVPVPDVLRHGDNWLVTTLLPGRALTEEPANDPVREQLGAAVAELHRISGPHFGYTGGRAAAGDWPTAFGTILDGLRADAAAWNVPLPQLDGLVERHHGRLSEVTRPALVHFDLWDGNVLFVGDRLTGLVDGERFLYGDPLIDFVSPALLRRIEDEPDNPFVRGYGPTELDSIRLGLYRVFLYVLMLAEGPSRAIPVGSARHNHVTGLLNAELERL